MSQEFKLNQGMQNSQTLDSMNPHATRFELIDDENEIKLSLPARESDVHSNEPLEMAHGAAVTSSACL